MSELVSVILLAHNEAGSIQREIAAFHETVLRRLPEHEFIVAEDGSVDGTRERIEAVRDRYELKIVGAVERLGYARAVRNAVAQAGGVFIFLCDAGEKHDPADFWRLHARRHDADVIVGRKSGRTDQIYRRLLTAGLNLCVRSLFDIEAFDIDSGIRLYTRRVADEVIAGPMHFRGFVSTEIALRASHRGLRYLEVPVSYRQRLGESRGLPLRTMPRAIRGVVADLWRLRRELGLPYNSVTKVSDRTQ